jgi:hypothetical protein
MIERQEVRECSICKSNFVGYGHNPEPLAQVEERCCEECNDRFVVPVRGMLGRGAAAENPETLQFVKHLAAYGKFLVESKRLISAQRKKRA